MGYRNYLLKRAQVDLSNARYACKQTEKEIGQVVQKRIEVARQCTDEGAKGVDVARYQIFKSFLQKLEGDLEQAHIRLQEGKEQVAKKEALLKKASINKKALARLKELQQKKHIERLERETQKVLDEIVVIGRESKNDKVA